MSDEWRENFARKILDQVTAIMAQVGVTPHQKLGQIRFTVDAMVMSACVRHILVVPHGLKVYAGPFAGMLYLEHAVGSAIAPKLLGTYEAELHGLIQSLPGRHYPAVVNIGCAEGYYAVGLARMLPGIRVLAYDTDLAARQLCHELAVINGVTDRVTIAGECTHAALEELAAGGPLILCDIDGGELALLDPSRVPGLRECDMLVETHGGVAQQLSERFAPSHEVQLIPNAGRNPYAHPLLKDVHQVDHGLLLNECRPGPTPWVWLASRSRSAALAAGT